MSLITQFTLSQPHGDSIDRGNSQEAHASRLAMERHQSWRRAMEQAEFSAWFPSPHGTCSESQMVRDGVNGVAQCGGASGRRCELSETIAKGIQSNGHVVGEERISPDSFSPHSVRVMTSERCATTLTVDSSEDVGRDSGSSDAAVLESAYGIASAVSRASFTQTQMGIAGRFGATIGAPELSLAAGIVAHLNSSVLELGGHTLVMSDPIITTNTNALAAPLNGAYLSSIDKSPRDDGGFVLALDEEAQAKESCGRDSEAAESRPLRLHAEWAEGGVRIWLGVDRDGVLHLDQLLSHIQSWLESQGTTLVGLVCNGRIVRSSRSGGNSADPESNFPEQYQRVVAQRLNSGRFGEEEKSLVSIVKFVGKEAV